MVIKRIYGELSKKKKRVAAYCRVSTDTAGQQESYETQVRYYRNLIPANDEWEYVGVYADEGRSGTSAKRRPEFLRLMHDVDDGKIDIILTKSISRFARNIVECQRYVKYLKAKDVEVRFERENISSMDASSDFIFSMMATVAQEESRSISENVRWRYAKDFENGVYRIGNNRILGYDMNTEGQLIPNCDAWIIQRVFNNFINGMNYTEIAADLDKMGARRLRSNKPYNAERIRQILKNEYYVGDMMLRKNAPKDFLTNLSVTEDYTSYYVRNAHKGIIDRVTWERTKEKLEAVAANKNAGLVFNCTETHFLYGKVFCGECGVPYIRRTYTDHKGGHYKAWNCRERQKGKKGNGCKNSSVREDKILAEITSSLGSKEFNRADVENLVERILITSEEITVKLKNNSTLVNIETVIKTA